MLSNDAHQGLQNGDIVYFLSDKNDPYCVRSIPSDQAERGSLHAFSPCEDGSVDASHQSCYLEVVRDGKWIGFRSMYAEQVPAGKAEGNEQAVLLQHQLRDLGAV